MNRASPQSEQDHKGDGQEAEAEPEPENETGTTKAVRKPSPVQRAVSLSWLQQFVAQYRDECFTFTRREFTDDAHGGGNQHGIDINVEQLPEFRSARRSAEKAGTCKPVMVRYVNIPFKDMTTADVMEAIIRPMCRQKHKSFAEAVVMSDNIGDPTYFVSTSANFCVEVELDAVAFTALQISHAWDSLFVDLFDSVSNFLEGAAKDETFVWLVSARTSVFVR